MGSSQSDKGGLYLPTQRGQLRGDVVAGLSVAVVAIPQAIAYALVAEVPAEYGIYTLVIHALLGSVLSANHLMSLGPVNTQSLLVASVLSHLLRGESMSPQERGELYLQFVLGLTLIKGLLQTTFAVARLGAIARYFSLSVVVGFTAGAGLLIAAGQLPVFLGMDRPEPSVVPGAWASLWHIICHTEQIHVLAAVVGTLSLVILIATARISRMIPGPLLAIAVAAVVVAMSGWRDSMQFVTLGDGSLPRLGLANLTLRQWEDLLAGGLALSVLGLVETYSISKAVADKADVKVDANQELLSQGLIHTISSFFACIPGSGSLSRSALNVYAGAATRFSAVVLGVTVAVVFLFARDFATLVPLPALAALLLVISFQLIDLRSLLRMWQGDRLDGLVAVFTLLATITVPLHYAIFAGVFFNLAMFIRRTSQLRLMRMVAAPDGTFEEHEITGRLQTEVVFLQLEGDLFFGLADDFREQLNLVVGEDVKVVLFRLKRTHSMDTTVMRVLSQFIRKMEKQGALVLFCGVRRALLERMTKYGLVDQLGADNVFPTSGGIFDSAKKALARAEQFLEGQRGPISE